MKRGTIILLAFVGAATVGWWWGQRDGGMVSPRGEEVVSEKEYDKYSFPRLVEREDEAGEIEVEGEVFSYQSEGKRITGAVHQPEGKGPHPVVVMLRGYADKEVYRTGYGTDPAAKYYASQGYLTLAPDFLGYGGSDPEDEDNLGARVRRPASVLDLLSSLPSLPQVNLERVYLWGHSNGGQIGLSVLEVLGRRGELGIVTLVPVRAASLWAPVSKPFPYSILYYTDEADDRGKALRAAIAMWEEEYDPFLYSVDMYWDWLATPLQIHQGSADEAVPAEWSDELTAALEELGKEVEYYRYAGADHNLRPSWETVVARDAAWFD